MFGEIVCFVQTALDPVDAELALADAITYPVKTHVHCFGAALFYGIVGNTGGCAVVGLDRCGRLWVAEFLEACADGTSVF
jgi:hypothetical protein